MIKTWQQRCEEHPDHQQGIVTQQMIQDRMQEEIDELRQALAQINPDRSSEYAGVRMWIGDKTIQYSVTKVCIEQEMIEGLSMKLAADSCLKALKEKNT